MNRGMDNIAASDLIKAVNSYTFPASEPIFSCPTSQAKAAWAGVARPTKTDYFSIPSFWAASLFNCLEDVLLDEHFESLGAASVWEPINVEAALNEITDLLGQSIGPTLSVSHLQACYRTLNSQEFRGLMGIDTKGLFTVLWQSNHA